MLYIARYCDNIIIRILGAWHGARGVAWSYIELKIVTPYKGCGMVLYIARDCDTI